MFFIKLLFMFALSYLIYSLQSPNKVKNAEPGEITKDDMQMASEGDYICMFWGERWIQSPNILLFENLNTEPIRSSSKSAK